MVGGAKAAQVAPPAKTLTERITQPKAQPKSAANKKKETAAKGAGSGTRGRGKKPRNARPAKKTTEELDSEMADYFDASTQQNENAGSGAAATNGDAPMDDEIV